MYPVEISTNRNVTLTFKLRSWVGMRSRMSRKYELLGGLTGTIFGLFCIGVNLRLLCANTGAAHTLALTSRTLGFVLPFASYSESK
jgi:hypothetical protein